jgi:hypothetical protein
MGHFDSMLAYKMKLLTEIIKLKPNIILGDFNSAYCSNTHIFYGFLLKQVLYYAGLLKRDLDETDIKKIYLWNLMPIYYLHNAGYKYAIPSNEKDFVTSYRGQNIVDMVFHDNTVETNAIIVGLDVDDHNPVHITFQKNKVEQVLQDNIINNDFIDEQYKLFYDYYLQKPKFVFANDSNMMLSKDSHIVGMSLNPEELNSKMMQTKDSHIVGMSLNPEELNLKMMRKKDSHIVGMSLNPEEPVLEQQNHVDIETKTQLVGLIAEIHLKNKHIKDYANKYKNKKLLLPLAEESESLLENNQAVANYKLLINDFLNETPNKVKKNGPLLKKLNGDLDRNTEIYYYNDGPNIKYWDEKTDIEITIHTQNIMGVSIDEINEYVGACFLAYARFGKQEQVYQGKQIYQGKQEYQTIKEINKKNT